MSEFLPAFLIAYSDSSFTNPHEVVRPEEPPECSGNFTHMGAKYWGFETARHKATTLSEDGRGFLYSHHAYHWFHIGLYKTAKVNRITVSTRWFTGNQVPEIAIELNHGHNTTEVLGRTPLAPDQEHEFEIPPTEASECLVRCFHEGGIARVNLFGTPSGIEAPRVNLLESARISHISNEHYGKPADAVKGNREVDYMLGWESARSGFGEYALFHLAEATIVRDIIVDTYMHRLNPPLSCHIFGVHLDDDSGLEDAWEKRPAWTVEFADGLTVTPADFQAFMTEKKYLDVPADNPGEFQITLVNDHEALWKPLVSFGQLRPDTWHHFREMESTDPVTHILYSHYPNGGIHGLKVYGDT